MKRTILTFGLIAGAILSLVMVVSMRFEVMIGDNGAVIGYTTMVIAFLMVFVGIRSYRDTVVNGAISFGRAFQVGILITLIASACYVATWEVIYFNFAPDFMEKYASHQIEKARASGATERELDAKRVQMKQFSEMYKNPAVNAAMTFVEPFPVGLVITLVCAGVLRRKRSDPARLPTAA